MTKVVRDMDGKEIATIRRRPWGCGSLLAFVFILAVLIADLQGIWHFLTHLF